MSEYGVFSGPYFPAFGLNTDRDGNTEYFSVFSPNVGKYGPEKTPYLDTLHVVLCSTVTLLFKIGFFTYIILNLYLNISEHLFNRRYPENILLRFVSEWNEMAPPDYIPTPKIRWIDSSGRKMQKNKTSYWSWCCHQDIIQCSIVISEKHGKAMKFSGTSYSPNKKLYEVCVICAYFYVCDVLGDVWCDRVLGKKPRYFISWYYSSTTRK